MPKSNPEGYSGRFNNPSKSATDQQSIQKVRAEAKAARAKVSPEMRAEPYGSTDSKTSKQESGFSNKFKTAGQTTAEKKTAKMSSAFNGASKANKPNTEPEPEPKVRP